MKPLLKSSLAITACHVITPLDNPATTTWQAIRAGQSVTKQTAVADQLLDKDTALDRSIRLALSAARGATNDFSNLSLFCGTSKGPVSTFLAAMKNPLTMTQAQARHLQLGVGAMGTYLRERLTIDGPTHTSVAACSSGLHALHRAAAAIRQGACKRALVVAADSSLHPLFEASFDRLGVIAPREATGIRRCEPFGENGDGFFLIEAAAAILLERAENLNGKAPLAFLDHSWIGGDSTDLIKIDAATQTLRTGLRTVGGQSDIAFIHAHATGTTHDAYERAAIQAEFTNQPPVFSHKKYLGHSLGAAGLLSVALSAMCHQHRTTLDGHPVPANTHSITIAQGFGGHMGVVRLRGN